MLINERPEENRHPDFDNEASLKEADSRLGLKRVIEEYGFAPKNGNWKSFTCPFCKKKAKAQIIEHGKVPMFKCYSTSCPTGTKAMPAVQFIAQQTGLSNKDAFVAYLKMAVVWKDRTKWKGAAEDKPAPVQAPSESGGVANATVTPAVDGSAPGPLAASDPAVPVPDQKPPEAPAAPSDAPTQTAAPAGANNAEAADSKLPGAAAPSVPGNGPVSIKPAEPPHEPDGWRSLREFFSLLSLSDSDGDLLFGKRGLFYSTGAALRFRSNPKGNRDILLELEKKYGLAEMLAAGLWVPRDKVRKKDARPNAQFCGGGIIRKLKDGERPGSGQWKDDDGNLWGWVNPILIPYYDEVGELVSLRPHKGMGRSGTLVGTPQVYIPRGLGGALDGAQEVFFTVVITEGEFKAAALWQILGAGRTDGREPVGVVALPGISFVKHYETREVLDDWLRRVKCLEVIVVFDNEEKANPALQSFKADHRKRFDAEICARYLATDLAQKLHIRGRVGNLPASWRNLKGKADWDGAAAEIVRGKKLSPAS
jgi:hypothetical protein